MIICDFKNWMQTFYLQYHNSTHDIENDSKNFSKRGSTFLQLSNCDKALLVIGRNCL